MSVSQYFFDLVPRDSDRPPKTINSCRSVLHLAKHVFCTHCHSFDTGLYWNPSYFMPGLPRFVKKKIIKNPYRVVERLWLSVLNMWVLFSFTIDVTFLHDLWLLFSIISRRSLDFEQAAHNFSRSWYTICQHYCILKVVQSYIYLSHQLRNWVAQTYYNCFGKKSPKWVLLSLC